MILYPNHAHRWRPEPRAGDRVRGSARNAEGAVQPPNVRTGRLVLVNPSTVGPFVPLPAYDPDTLGGFLELRTQDAYCEVECTIRLDGGPTNDYTRRYRMGPASRLVVPACSVAVRYVAQPATAGNCDRFTGLINTGGVADRSISWTWFPLAPPDSEVQAITTTIAASTIAAVGYPPGYADECWIAGADTGSNASCVVRFADLDLFLGQASFTPGFFSNIAGGIFPVTPWSRVDIQNASGVAALNVLIVWRRRRTGLPQ
jgi:hypothetical protein